MRVSFSGYGNRAATSLTDAWLQTRPVAKVNSREVIRAIEAAGWFRVGQKGSHVQFRHAVRSGRVTVPHPKRDLAIKTLTSIAQQSGVKLR